MVSTHKQIHINIINKELYVQIPCICIVCKVNASQRCKTFGDYPLGVKARVAMLLYCLYKHD